MAIILIVDDEPNICLLLEQTLEELEDAGVEILTADNGESALEIIRKDRPDIIFLDVMMPKMNGFEVCDTIKNKLKLSDAFVIMLTAKGQEVDKLKGMEVGADIYMTKPFNPDEVAELAKRILKL